MPPRKSPPSLAGAKPWRRPSARAARSPYSAKELDEEERAAATEMASRETALQAAAPNYGQLVQEAVPAAGVFKALQPGEAFVGVTLTPRRGWTFLLRDGAIAVGRVRGGSGAVDPLVTRIRVAMTPETPAFDTSAAQALFKLVFADVATKLDGVHALTVAPSGSLLSLPFGVLLTGPGDPASLAAAPWLIKQAAIGHVPSAGNFVALRRVAGGSRAGRPWFGFGDFKPVSLAQAERSFGPSCGDAAQLLSRLPPLPSARQELAIAPSCSAPRRKTSCSARPSPSPRSQRLDLARYRVLHFATHAVLPSDLACQREPALITSPPAGAPDASGALLTASDLAQIKLDADLVILSACNSGGAEGKLGGGESLSALARSFFFGGARALLITHWEVSDQAATFIIADTLRRMRADPSLGPAAALAGVQSEMLTRTGSALPAAFAHPFYWAPFAIIGPAGTGASAARS